MKKLILFFKRLKVFCMTKHLKMCEYCAERGAFIRKHDEHRVEDILIKGPVVYHHFQINRFSGVVSYTIFRRVTRTCVFYYRKGKEDNIKNSICTVVDMSYQSIYIKMKAEIKEFLFHPPRFEPSIWVDARRGPVYIADTSKIERVNWNIDNDLLKKESIIDTYSVDLTDNTAFMVTHEFDDPFDTERVLKALYDKVLDSLSKEAREYQYRVSGIKDSMRLNKKFGLLPNLVCNACGRPLIARIVDKKLDKGSPVCMHHGEFAGNFHTPFTPIYVSDDEWDRTCEKYRSELREVRERGL